MTSIQLILQTTLILIKLRHWKLDGFHIDLFHIFTSLISCYWLFNRYAILCPVLLTHFGNFEEILIINHTIKITK